MRSFIRQQTKSLVRHPALVPVVAMLVSSVARAQGQEISQFRELATSIITILQGLGLTVAVAGFIFAGLKFNSGAPDAKDAAKNAVIGSALIAGASLLVGFVRGFFGT